MKNESSYTKTIWSLADLFPGMNAPELESSFTTLEEKTVAFERLRPQLSPEIPVEDFLNCVRMIEDSSRLAYRLYGFSSLSFAENTQNQAAQSLMARVEQFLANLENRTLFFNLWWKDLPDEAANRLMASAGDYRYWLEEIRHFKPFTLTEAEEKIINIKNVTGSSALNTLYDSITNRYTFKLTIDGETKEMTRGEIMVYARSNDPQIRQQAYQEMYRVFGTDGPILGQIYQTLVRDWRNEQMGLRGFRSPIAVRNLSNDIPDEVVDLLLDISQQNAPLFQHFFRLKARLLGMKSLRRYDIYAPLDNSAKTYPFEQAAGMVLDSFEGFDPQFAHHARRVFDQNHLDSEIRHGKRSGAFCLTALPDLTPWVLVNYQGKAQDVSTIAHELGHAVHSMLAANHSLFTFHPSLPLAETASTFAEMLLTDHLLKDEVDPAVRRDLLFSRVDDSYATIMRQAYFALFERQAHQMINDGASVDELSNAYLESLKSQFGDSVEVPDEFRWEWVSIPHIYQTPFYVYAYSFGQLLVLSLYQQYRLEGESFLPRYRQLLSAGGSQSPLGILKDAGIDVHQSSFWQGGFDVIRDLIEQLDKGA
jgi:oligoendopeptidase F